MLSDKRPRFWHRMRMSWRLTIFGLISAVAAAAGIGVASGESESASDTPGAVCIPGISAAEGIIHCEDALPPQFADGPPIEITRCADVPPIPPDGDVSPGWSTSGADVLASFLLSAPEGDSGELFEFIVRVDDPTCKKRPDIWKYFDVNTEPPRFEDARIVVRPGEDRAYVGYKLTDTKTASQRPEPTEVRSIGGIKLRRAARRRSEHTEYG
jgi:hypothetical protein